MQVVLEGLEGEIPLAELCNKYQMRQSMFYYWLRELQSKGHKIFESAKTSKKNKGYKKKSKSLNLP